MDGAKLLENTVLCYLLLTKIKEWLKENNLWKKDFTEIRKQWQKINSPEIKLSGTAEKEITKPEITPLPLKELLKSPPISFFIDTELLIIEQDIILLQVVDENVREYLAKNYSIQEQAICQKLFGENKHLILLTPKQWNFLNENSEQINNDEAKKQTDNNFSAALVLFKDEATIKNKLSQWLENYK